MMANHTKNFHETTSPRRKNAYMLANIGMSNPASDIFQISKCQNAITRSQNPSMLSAHDMTRSQTEGRLFHRFQNSPRSKIRANTNAQSASVHMDMLMTRKGETCS